jgi:hypothetical protein
MLVKILFVVTVALSLKDGSLEDYELGLLGMAAVVMLFVTPGSDHKS